MGKERRRSREAEVRTAGNLLLSDGRCLPVGSHRTCADFDSASSLDWSPNAIPGWKRIKGDGIWYRKRKYIIEKVVSITLQQQLPRWKRIYRLGGYISSAVFGNLLQNIWDSFGHLSGLIGYEMTAIRDGAVAGGTCRVSGSAG